MVDCNLFWKWCISLLLCPQNWGFFILKVNQTLYLVSGPDFQPCPTCSLLKWSIAPGKNRTPAYSLWTALDRWSCDRAETCRTCSWCKHTHTRIESYQHRSLNRAETECRRIWCKLDARVCREAFNTYSTYWFRNASLLLFFLLFLCLQGLSILLPSAKLDGCVYAVILSALFALWVGGKDRADSGSKVSAVFGAKSSCSSVLWIRPLVLIRNVNISTIKKSTKPPLLFMK